MSTEQSNPASCNVAFTEEMLENGLHELHSCTEVTMETVGAKCGRRVNTTVYKKGLHLLQGEVVIQPPSEDKVSIFTSLSNGKQAAIKFFSTGKIRCLRSDFKSKEHAETCAQTCLQQLADMKDAGMPPICLADAKLHANAKDYTWSTRQTICMKQLIPALQVAGVRAQSDTQFGDSVMVVISPQGSDRQIKGQVLADGTIRLAGCRGDGVTAARAVVKSLNETDCLQGGNVDVKSIACEVWLTKRHFHLCGEDKVVDIDSLHAILSSKNTPTQHPQLLEWIQSRKPQQASVCVQSVNKVGSTCCRLDIKFMPVSIREWEKVQRKPEPVSVTVHYRGEVQLAGNAEYKVLQAYWFIQDIMSRNTTSLLLPSPFQQGQRSASKGIKRKLEVIVDNAQPDHTPEDTPAHFHTPSQSNRSASYLDSPSLSSSVVESPASAGIMNRTADSLVHARSYADSASLSKSPVSAGITNHMADSRVHARSCADSPSLPKSPVSAGIMLRMGLQADSLLHAPSYADSASLPKSPVSAGIMLRMGLQADSSLHARSYLDSPSFSASITKSPVDSPRAAQHADIQHVACWYLDSSNLLSTTESAYLSRDSPRAALHADTLHLSRRHLDSPDLLPTIEAAIRSKKTPRVVMPAQEVAVPPPMGLPWKARLMSLGTGRNPEIVAYTRRESGQKLGNKHNQREKAGFADRYMEKENVPPEGRLVEKWGACMDVDTAAQRMGDDRCVGKDYVTPVRSCVVAACAHAQDSPQSNNVSAHTPVQTVKENTSACTPTQTLHESMKSVLDINMKGVKDSNGKDVVDTSMPDTCKNAPAERLRAPYFGQPFSSDLLPPPKGLFHERQMSMLRILREHCASQDAAHCTQHETGTHLEASPACLAPLAHAGEQRSSVHNGTLQCLPEMKVVETPRRSCAYEAVEQTPCRNLLAYNSTPFSSGERITVRANVDGALSQAACMLSPLDMSSIDSPWSLQSPSKRRRGDAIGSFK